MYRISHVVVVVVVGDIVVCTAAPVVVLGGIYLPTGVPGGVVPAPVCPSGDERKSGRDREGRSDIARHRTGLTSLLGAGSCTAAVCPPPIRSLTRSGSRQS